MESGEKITRPKLQEDSMAFSEVIIVRDGHFNNENKLDKVTIPSDNPNVPQWLRELHGQWETEINECMPENKRKWFQKQANLLSDSDCVSLASNNTSISSTSDPNTDVPDTDSDTDSVLTEDVDLVSISSEESLVKQLSRPQRHHGKFNTLPAPSRIHTSPATLTGIDFSPAHGSTDAASPTSAAPAGEEEMTHRLSGSKSATNLQDHQKLAKRRHTTPAGKASDLEALTQPIQEPLPSQKRSGVRRLIGGLFSKKDKGRVQFEAYSHALKVSLDRHEKNLFKNQLERKKLARTMKAEIRKWKKFGIVRLETAAQTLYETSLLEMSTCRDVELKYCTVLTAKINAVQLGLDGKPIRELPELEFNEDGTFIDPEHIKLPDEFIPLVASLKSMKDVIHELTSNYLALQKSELRQVSFEERCQKMDDILTIAHQHRERTAQVNEKSVFHYHPPDDKGSQVDFNSLMIDERQFEGKLLKRWRRLMAGSETGVSATAVKTFIDYMIHTIVNTYSLEEELEQTLQLMLNRLIFPRISPVWLALRSPKEVEQDQCFWKKIAWLKHLSQTQLGIEEQFQCDVSVVSEEMPSTEEYFDDNFIWPGFPYYDAIVALSELRQYCVPEDMLHCLLLSIRLIHSCAKQYCGNENVVISADSLFPLIVWTTIHAHLHDVNMAIGHLERFLKDDVKYFGEVGICLSLVEAAVCFVNQRKPSDYNLPVEVEERPNVIDKTSLYTLPERLCAEREQQRMETPDSTPTDSSKSNESPVKSDDTSSSPHPSPRPAPRDPPRNLRKGSISIQTTFMDASELDSILGTTPMDGSEMNYLSSMTRMQPRLPEQKSTAGETELPAFIPDQNQSKHNRVAPNGVAVAKELHKNGIPAISPPSSLTRLPSTPIWSAGHEPETPHTIVIVCRRHITLKSTSHSPSSPSSQSARSSPSSPSNKQPLESEAKSDQISDQSNSIGLTEEDFVALYSPIGEIADIQIEASSNNFVLRSVITFMNAADATKAVFETKQERRQRIDNLSSQTEQSFSRWEDLTFSVKFSSSSRIPRRLRKECSIQLTEFNFNKILDAVALGDSLKSYQPSSSRSRANSLPLLTENSNSFRERTNLVPTATSVLDRSSILFQPSENGHLFQNKDEDG